METHRFLMVSTHYPPQHLGGDAIFVKYLSEELIKRGHDVHVMYNPTAYQMLRKPKKAPPSAIDDNGPVRHPFVSSTGRLDPLLALTFGRWGGAKRKLDSLVKDLLPDVVHWHNTRGFIGRPYSFPGRISLYTNHDYTPICPRSNLLKPDLSPCNDPRWCTICCMKWGKPPHLWRVGKRRVLRYDEGLKLLAPSQFMANRFRTEGVVVHRVLRLFVPDLADRYTRSDSVQDSIVYLGLLERHKGIQTLFDAFVESKDRQGFRLHMIGEGSMKEGLRRQAEQWKLTNRLQIPGYLSRDAVENIRKDAVAQVVPSIWYENAPSTAVEALSLGVPVIASDIGGLPEMVTADSGSETFPAGDVHELADLLVRFWDERNKLEARRGKARTTYETKFRPEIHIAEYLNTIKAM